MLSNKTIGVLFNDGTKLLQEDRTSNIGKHIHIQEIINEDGIAKKTEINQEIDLENCPWPFKEKRLHFL